MTVAALGVAGGALLVPLAGAASARPAEPVPLTVQAEPGAVARATASLGAGGLRVQRRRGSELQVVAAPRRAAALARLPGIAGARPAVTAFSDQPDASDEPDASDRTAVSQGIERTGGDVLGRVANGGEGLLIAVLDLGFGQNIATQQRRGELPPTAQLETMSFDGAGGFAGRNAYGHRTNHGEIVAQTVYDYAPEARYLFVNYHTPTDFLVATDAIIARRPDIVVHSNSFIEGPFDGTSEAARAVDRAAAAGTLWFNSAGNYARLHWSGPWIDADGDADLDWPNGDNWSFFRGAGLPITFALSWASPPGEPPTDIDLLLERQEPSGEWRPVAGSGDRQSAGAKTAERIVGYSPPGDAFFRLRAVHVSGPPPHGPLVLFSREIQLADIGGTLESSTPTPGDAAGAIAVGAVDWRGDAFKGYSSQGPTDDGRLKPDIVAPTDTRIMGPQGFRSIGGTSNAAPNAAGAAAVMLAAERRAGRFPSAAEIRGQLSALALDLGVPGPDAVFGAGRVRVAIRPPRIARANPKPLASVRGRVTVKFKALGRTRPTQWRLDLDGEPATRRAQRYPRGITIDTRKLEDGWHALRVELRDRPGNTGVREWSVKVDNTRPTLVVRRVEVTRARRSQAERSARAARRAGALRQVRLVVAAQDPGSSGALRARVEIRPRRGKASVRTSRVKPGDLRRVSLGRLAPGRYRVRADLSDRAGNRDRVTKTILVR